PLLDLGGRIELLVAGEVQDTVGGDKASVADARKSRVLGQEVLLPTGLKDEYFLIAGSHVELAVGQQRRAPRRRQGVVSPKPLARFKLDAVDEACELHGVHQPILDGDAGDAGAEVVARHLPE